MANSVQFSTANGKLTIVVDISEAAVQAAPPSSTGKTRLVASATKVAVGQVAGKDIAFSLNVMSSR